ncbi:MAG: hypothetical protein ACYC61_05445 [Isosphaeraceae bacterium]
MSAAIPARRRPLPSILTVYRPIEEYRESASSGEVAGASELLGPLDAFLVHRLLDLLPGEPVLIDGAIVATGGSSSLVGLNHPRVRAVWGVADGNNDACREAVSSLRDHLGRRAADGPNLGVLPAAELPPGLTRVSTPVVLLDASGDRCASLAEQVGDWLDRRPNAVVLVLGLGKVGQCPAMASLVGRCTPESGLRLDLLRELNEVLMASRMALVASRGNEGVSLAIERLRLSYTGNFRYVDLLRQVNDTAMRQANIDVDTLRAHPTFGPLSEEIEGLKRAAREADERAAAAAQALRDAQGWFSRQVAAPEPSPMPMPMPAVGVMIPGSPSPSNRARHAIQKVRHRLAPTPVGGAWRMAKRVRRKLAPTPVGGAWRMAKRGIKAVIGRRG